MLPYTLRILLVKVRLEDLENLRNLARGDWNDPSNSSLYVFHLVQEDVE